MGQKRRVKGPISVQSPMGAADNRKSEAHQQFFPYEDRKTSARSFILQDVFGPHPISGSHDHQFSMCWNHDSVYHACWQIDVAYHWRLPDVGLVQFRPSPKLGSNDFLAGSESFIVSFR
jgi:hypothetical protein